jgi:hypothetical protein
MSTNEELIHEVLDECRKSIHPLVAGLTEEDVSVISALKKMLNKVEDLLKEKGVLCDCQEFEHGRCIACGRSQW